MTTDIELMNKSYYKSLMINQESNHPIETLGEMFLSKQHHEPTNLAEIRFAQGEVYYHSKDFEAAIFKWENIKGELEYWAKKNIADAYFELGQYSKAENIYKTIQSQNIILDSEIILQLFSLYIEQEKLEAAFATIKKGVSLNPDYPNMTKIARTFYEEQQDWSNALELVIQEAIRKESKSWFDTLKMYVDQGYTRGISPDYFTSALKTLYKVDQVRFEQMVISLWNCYRNQETYLDWLRTFNNLFLQIEIIRIDSWSELSNQYEKAYMDLIDGKYYMSELSTVIPNFLTNWLKISTAQQTLFSTAALLAWNEVYPESFSTDVVEEAKDRICTGKKYQQSSLTESFVLLEQILNWAQENDLKLGNRSKWWMRELIDLDVHHLLVAGVYGNGKTDVINTLLGEEILGTVSTTVVMFKDGENTDINEITDTKISRIETLSEFDNLTTLNYQKEACIDFTFPCQFLRENQLAIIDTPDIKGSNEKNEVFKHLHLADSLLFVLDANAPFSDKEAEILQQIQDHTPNLPIHFILNNMDTIYSERDASNIVEETQVRINKLFPSANILPYVSVYHNRQQLKKVAEFINANMMTRNHEDDRNVKLLFFIRKTIMLILDKRFEAEKELINTIEWKENIEGKLKGAINQLKDLEKEKSTAIIKNYCDMKNEIKKEMITNIPKVIKSCVDIINDESDFREIHVELNEEMNRRVQHFLEEKIVPKVYQSIQAWISFSHEQFEQSRAFLDEMNESFHALVGAEQLNLEFDFQVLNDWQRDGDRLTSRIQYPTENILLRLSPTQLLLKGAGKLLGAMGQNKNMLSTKYKKYIENEDFYNVAISITKNFLIQFELFENALERDIAIFFSKALNGLHNQVAITRDEITEIEFTLMKMKENPEVYQDPLAIFEVRLRQFELIMNVKQKNSPYPYLELPKKMVQL